MISFVKKYKVLFLAFIIVLIISVVGVYMHQTKAIHNVFEEMMYSLQETQTLDSSPEPGFGRVESVHGSQNTTMLFYKELYLNDDEKLTVIPGDGKTGISFFYTKTFEDSEIYVVFRYEKETSVLSCEPITGSSDNGYSVESILASNGVTRDQIEDIKQYVLYDKILTDWFEGNQGISNFAIDTLGDFTYIDNSFKDIDEF